MSQPERLIVRPFEDADETGVARLWREVFPNDPPWNEPTRVLEKKRAVQRELLLVGLIDGVVVGTVMGGYDGHRGWVYTLAVQPALRRRGIGAALMHRLETALVSLGCDKVNLQVRAGNETVLAFYERLGYSQEPRVSMGKLLSGGG